MNKLLLCLLVSFFAIKTFAQPSKQWSAAKANAWYKQQGWHAGSNFLPSSAINQLEMWQAETFDPKRIDLELGWAAAIGDDRLQREAQGYVVPDSFTHGTSEQRVRWFRKGFETGDINQGDTFNTERP